MPALYIKNKFYANPKDSPKESFGFMERHPFGIINFKKL
jgi:hypothetical protein